MERGHSERLVRTQRLKAWGESRDSYLERGNTRTSESKLTFNITYNPVFQNVRSILQELQIMLAPDKEHEKVFTEVPIVGFWSGKSIKDYLVRAALPKIDNTGGSKPCGKGTCQVFDRIITTELTLLQQKHEGKYLKFKVGHLTVTQKKFFTFWNAKFGMILPVLERLKQSFTLSFIITKINTDLFGKENRMYHRSVYQYNRWGY